MSRIPKKLHFTYAINELPKKYRDNLKQWQAMCPDWKFQFYTDKEVYALFEDHLPIYYKELSKIPYGAMLADLFRYAVLYVYGGLYSDIDTVPLKPLPENWLQSTAVIGYEVQTEQWEFFCQWTLLSQPKNPLFKEALDGAFCKLRQLDYCIDCVDKVLETTGPIFFTSVVKNYRRSPGLLLLDADYFAKCPEAGLPFTERSVVQHQFDGEFTWKLCLKCPQLRLNRGGL